MACKEVFSPLMLLFLSKLLSALLAPVGLVVLLCLFATWLAIRRKAWMPAGAAFLAAALLYTAASPRVANTLVLGLELRNRPALVYPKAAAIVLLGGGMLPAAAPRLRPETGAAGDRVIHAARLWRQKRAPRLVVTGGYIPYLTRATGSEADLYAEFLTEMFDVPDGSILRVGGSRTTHEDATLSARLFDSLGIKKEILLVTSATHMPRAAALFRKNGFTVHPSPTDFNGRENDPFLLFQLLPSAEALAQTNVALREYVGLWAYRMLGRI
jgi:uncharacterized SAM-binding protein YcdF (DUF218 family)